MGHYLFTLLRKIHIYNYKLNYSTRCKLYKLQLIVIHTLYLFFPLCNTHAMYLYNIWKVLHVLPVLKPEV